MPGIGFLSNKFGWNYLKNQVRNTHYSIRTCRIQTIYFGVISDGNKVVTKRTLKQTLSPSPQSEIKVTWKPTSTGSYK